MRGEQPPPSNGSSTTVTDLDVDSLAHCASYLSLRDVSNMAISCAYLNRVAYSDSIWQSLYRGNLWDTRRVSDLTKAEPTAELQGHMRPITHIHMDSYKIVTGGPGDDCVNVWDVETGRNTNSFQCSAPDREPVYGCSAMAVDGCRIITVGSKGPETTTVIFRDFWSATEYKESTSIVSSNESEAGLGVSKFWDLR